MSLVVAHLRHHRKAADTFDGVARWWLGADGDRVAPEALRCALQRLVAAGSLCSRALPSGETLWYAPPETDDEPRGAPGARE